MSVQKSRLQKLESELKTTIKTRAYFDCSGRMSGKSTMQLRWFMQKAQKINDIIEKIRLIKQNLAYKKLRKVVKNG